MTTASVNANLSVEPDTPVAAGPPVAGRVPKVSILHGDERVDDYFWLRDKSNPEVAAYLEAENAYTDAVMKPTAAFQEALYTEMLARIQETDLSVPYREGAYFYYSRTEEGKQYPILCRKKGSASELIEGPGGRGAGSVSGPAVPPALARATRSGAVASELIEGLEEVTLDLNLLAEGQKFLSVGVYSVSDDGRLLAYSTDTTGFRDYTLVVKDLETGQLLPFRVEKVGSVAWAADNRTLFYTTEDEAKRAYRLYRHHLEEAEDTLLYEEEDERFRVFTGRTRSKAYVLLASGSHTTTEWRYLAADAPTGEWKLVAPRRQEHEYDVDHHGDRFYIRTNDQGRNFRLVEAPLADPRPHNWKEVVPHRPDVMLEGAEFFKHHYVRLERADGLPRMVVTDFRTGASHTMTFPEPAYSASPGPNPEFDTTVFRYSYESLVTPRSIFDYDMDERTARLMKETPVLGGYDRTLFQSERIYATAPDGVRVPLSIVYKKGRKRDGSHPCFLTAYGAYGYPLPVTFSSNRLSLLDRGVVFALAHIRGGGEMGKSWHDDGRMMKKRNTFTDFIAAAEHLVRERYTSADRLVVEGGSAGGLLMGAVANMRPDLFKAVVSKVPFVDVVNTMLDDDLPLTVGEYEEWGNPKIKDDYVYLKSYCPYTNQERKAYPAMLVKTAFNDSQVMYWEPAKYVARLRTLKTDQNPLLLKTNMEAGHGGASGRYDFLREIALDYAFILGQYGITC